MLSEHEGATTNGAIAENDGPKRLTDLASLNTAGPAEQGTDVDLENPFTKQVLIGTDGEPMTWTLRGDDAPSVRRVTKRHQDKRNERISKGKGADLDTDTLEAQRLERILAATIRYSDNFPPLDGQPMPFTTANARKMLTDPRFNWLPELLAEAIGDRKRFLPLTSTS